MLELLKILYNNLTVILLTVVFILPAKAITSQNSTPDSLLVIIHSSENDSVKIATLREIVNYWKNTDCDSSIYYSRILAKKAKVHGPENYYYKGLYWLINCYGIAGTYDSSLHYAFDGIEHFKNDSASFPKTVLHILAGEQYRAMAMFDNSIFYLNIAWNLAHEIEQPHIYYSISNRLAAVHYENKEIEDAIFWADTSMHIGAKINDNDYLISNLNIKGSVLRDMGQYKEALVTFNQALLFAIETYDSKRIAEIQNSIANTYRAINEPEKSIEFALPSFNHTSHKGIDALTIVSSEILSYAYAEIGLFERAYEFSRVYEKIKSKVFFEERDKQIAELNTAYETEQKENQILLQKINLEKKDLQIKQRNYITVLMLLVLIILALFLIYRYLTNQRLKAAYSKLKRLADYKQSTTSMLVHDLKNPLNLLTNIEVLDDSVDKNQIIKRSSRQMLHLVMNMLDVSKSEHESLQLSIEKHSLNSIVDDALQEVIHQANFKNIKVVLKNQNDYLINSDKHIFGRVLTNLLTNAIKFSSKGDTIEIGTVCIDDNSLRVYVKDNGIGIASEFQNTIFEQYSQANNSEYHGATGLGLAFCKIAVDAHKWQIGVISEADKGSEFFIDIEGHDKSVSKQKNDQTENKRSNTLNLSKNDRLKLTPLINRLIQLNVYSISEVKNVLSEIREMKISDLDFTIKESLVATETMNEEKYVSIVKTLTNEIK